jgi:hypothetical protein
MSKKNEVIIVNSPSLEAFKEDFKFIEKWLKDEVIDHINSLYDKKIIDYTLDWSLVFNKHVSMGFKLHFKEQDIDGYKVKDVLQTQIRNFGTGYRSFYTYDHPVKVLTIITFPYFKAEKLESLPKITDIFKAESSFKKGLVAEKFKD